jgi:hypothetical protein
MSALPYAVRFLTYRLGDCTIPCYLGVLHEHVRSWDSDIGKLLVSLIVQA